MQIHMLSQVRLDQGFVCESEAMKRGVEQLRRAARSHLCVCVHGGPGAPLAAAARQLVGSDEGSPALEVFGGVHSAEELVTRLFDEQGFSLCETLILHDLTLFPGSVLRRLASLYEQRSPHAMRLISTTRVPLTPALDAHLALRLAPVRLTMPALTTRTEDILPLAMHFISEFNTRKDASRHVTALTESVRLRLLAHPWPGDELELFNLIAHVFLMGQGNVWSEDELPFHLKDLSPQHDESSTSQAELEPAHDAASSEERDRIVNALTCAEGNRTRAAKMLGLSRTTLWRKLREHGMS